MLKKNSCVSMSQIIVKFFPTVFHPNGFSCASVFASAYINISTFSVELKHFNYKKKKKKKSIAGLHCQAKFHLIYLRSEGISFFSHVIDYQV